MEGAEQVGHSHPQVEVDQVDHFPQSEAAPADHLQIRTTEHLKISTRNHILSDATETHCYVDFL